MQHLGRANDFERQIGGPHTARSRTRAKIAELVSGPPVGHEIDAGRSFGVHAYTGDVDAFALPQREELTTEAVGADAGHIRCAGAEPRRGDCAVRRVAAEAVQVFVA